MPNVAQQPLIGSHAEEMASALRDARKKTGRTMARQAALLGVSVRQYRRYETRETALPIHRAAILYENTQRDIVARLPTNREGRDFVVSDLHGHGPVFRHFLADRDFDPQRDRVFSVGDLVDRGPHSLDTLRLLCEPWFHAVRGNHEDLLWDFCLSEGHYGKADADHPFLANGGRWILNLSSTEQEELRYRLLPRVGLLPHILIVGTGDRRYHVVHAELDGPKARIDDAVLDLLESGPRPDIVPLEYIEGFDGADYWRMRLLWGRSLVNAAIVSPEIPGLSPTFVGHTIVREVFQRGSHIFLDTGAARMAEDAVRAQVAHITVLEIPQGDLNAITPRAIFAPRKNIA